MKAKADKRTSTPPQFNIGEAKAAFEELVDRAHAGEVIIIAKRGRPIARLEPPIGLFDSTDPKSGA